MTGFRRFQISEPMLIQLFAPGDHLRGYRVTQGGIPADARIIGVNHDPYTYELTLTLASDSWEALAPGCVIPILETWIEDGGEITQ